MAGPPPPPRKTPPKAPAKKKTPPKKEPKRRAQPAYGARGGVPNNPLLPKPGDDNGFIDALRKAVAPPVDLWNAVRPYTPAPTVKKVVKTATPAPARALTKAAPVVDKAIGTSIDAAAAIPGTLRTPMRPGAKPPINSVKAISTGALAQRISAPHVDIKVGVAELSPQYQTFFKGQNKVSLDEIKQAADTLSAGVRQSPPPMSDDQLGKRLKAIEANGWDLRDAKHWTFDDVIAKSLMKNEKTPIGFVRNTMAGLVGLAGLPSGLVAGAGAGIAALGGNTKPAEEFGKQAWDFTRNTLPVVGNKPFTTELYENLPGVAANVLPITKGASAFLGRGFLKAGERDIRLPGTNSVETTHVPADLLKRGTFEVRKALIESGKGPGKKLEKRAEKRVADSLFTRAELERDFTLQPLQRDLSTAARHTATREGRVPLVPHTGGETRVAQVVEATAAGKTPAQVARFRTDEGRRQAQLAHDKAQEAVALRDQARQKLDAGDYAGGERDQHFANIADAEARTASLAAERNELHAQLMEVAQDIPADHPLAAAVRAASGRISDIKEELASPKRGLTEDARIFGDEERNLRISADDASDPVRQRAAQDILEIRKKIQDAQKRAQARARGEDTGGRSHAERGALGGLSELDTVGNREATHIHGAGEDVRTAAETRDRRLATPEEAPGRPTITTEATGEDFLHAGKEGGYSSKSNATRAMRKLRDSRPAGPGQPPVQTRVFRDGDGWNFEVHQPSARRTVTTPAEPGRARLGVEQSPFTPHEGIAPAEHTKIKEDLGNIAELHISKERARRKGIRKQIGTIRHQLTEPDLSPLRRTDLQAEQKALIEQLNTPTARTMQKIQREIDAYLRRFGRRMTDREKRRYAAKRLVGDALMKQAKGDLVAVTKRERKLQERTQRERANSSRAHREDAAALQEQYGQMLRDYQTEFGGGTHVPMAQPPVPRGRIRGYVNTAARGIKPRNVDLRIKHSTGAQVLGANYSPIRTLGAIQRELRSLSDQLGSVKLYQSLLDTHLVRDATGMEGYTVPAGWHWVSADNLAKFSNHPMHIADADEVRRAIDEGQPDGVRKSAWKALREDISQVKDQVHTSVPSERGFLIRESALEALEDAIKRHDAGDYDLFLKVTNEYRKFLLFMLPRTFVNNMIGNIGLALTSGASMADIIRAHHFIRKHPEAVPSLIRNRGLTAQLFGPEATGSLYMDFWRRANTYAEDLGQAATYVSQLRAYGKGKGLDVRGQEGMLKSMDDISTEWHRVATDLAKGKDPNVIPLMQKSKQFFGDVAKQTKTNKALAGAVLFHRWLGHIIKLVTYTLPFKYPGRFAIIYRLSQIGDDYRKQHGVLPDWAQGVVKLTMEHVHTPSGVQDVVLGLSTTGLNPAQSFSQIGDLGTDSSPLFPGQAIAAGALSPVLSVPFQAGTGFNLATGRRFTDRYGNEMGPGQMAALALHLGWANAPVLATGLSTAGSSGDSTPWDRAPAASTPAAYRRQLAHPELIHATSPSSWPYTLLRASGVPITRLDSYGFRYNQHISSLAYALQKKAADAANKQLKPPKRSAPAPAGPAAKPAVASKPLTPVQRKQAQKDYAEKVRKAQGSGGADSIRKKQKAYADKVRSGG